MLEPDMSRPTERCSRPSLRSWRLNAWDEFKAGFLEASDEDRYLWAATVLLSGLCGVIS
jgi:hypothetical protein